VAVAIDSVITRVRTYLLTVNDGKLCIIIDARRSKCTVLVPD
jgi:hypothetical protein